MANKISRRVLGDSVEVHFLCPGCGNTHWLPVDGSAPQRPKWQWNGDYEKPTLSPSILYRSGHYIPQHASAECWCTYNAEHPDEKGPECVICHSFVRDGRIEFLSDCTHALAGQTVDLPDVG
jgi:hypothetical protein